MLPFGLLAVSLARLPWRIGWVKVLYVQLAAMAFVFAAIGVWQYLTRNMFWNPKVIVDNAYAPSSWFYRVNSVFYDPSIYGRFLVVAILASLVLVLFGRRAARLGRARGRVSRPGPGSSRRSRSRASSRSASAIVVALVVALAAARDHPARSSRSPRSRVVTLGVPQIRHRLLGKAGFSHATGGRSKLVSNGVEIARAPSGGRRRRRRLQVRVRRARTARLQGQGAEGRGVAQHADHGRGRDGPAGARCCSPGSSSRRSSLALPRNPVATDDRTRAARRSD